MPTEELYKIVFSSEGSISTDTRTIVPGDVYVGLKGEQFDGNEYAKDALEQGARLAIVDNPHFAIDDRYIVVADTYQMLKDLATMHRQKFTIPILAIGGSNGKTTTKELVSAVLATTHIVHTTRGNFNNEIGVPLTILAMKPETDIAVIEIGANHPDEHTRLMQIVSPTHVLVTNNGKDHLEGFISIEGVRAANKEIFDCAKAIGAAAFVNKHIVDLVADSADMNRTLYPEQPYESTSTLFASLKYDNLPFESQLFGSFNEANMLAAIAVGTYFNVSSEKIAEAIKNYRPTLKRSQVIEKDGHTLVIDCYNANPTSMELALKDFFHISEPGKRVIVIGDMFEVGATELQAHRDILQLVAESVAANDTVICVGPRLSTYAKDFPFAFFMTPADAKDSFDALNLSGKKVFLKASRGVKLEDMLS